MGQQACFLLAAILAAAPLSAALAQPAPMPPPGQMAPAGQMAPLPPLPEFQARMRKHLMMMDTDHDGRISLQEWTAWHATHPGHGGDPARQFQMLDRNHDGFITPDEIDAHSAQAYARRSARAAAGAAAAPAPAPGLPRPAILTSRSSRSARPPSSWVSVPFAAGPSRVIASGEHGFADPARPSSRTSRGGDPGPSRCVVAAGSRLCAALRPE